MLAFYDISVSDGVSVAGEEARHATSETKGRGGSRGYGLLSVVVAEHFIYRLGAYRFVHRGAHLLGLQVENL